MAFLFPHVLVAIGALGFYFQGPFVWTGFVVLFVVFPFAEYLTKHIEFRSEKFDSAWANRFLYLMPLSLTAFFIFSLYQALTLTSLSETLGVVFSAAAVLGAFGITSAHELVHRRQKWQRALGVYNLMLLNFAHWGLEHVFGHHKYVATSDDPATARKNENVYSFWARNYFGVLKAAYHLAPQKVTGYFVISIAASLTLGFLFGVKIVIMWWSISILAILLLQTVDYIEHYGLVRPKNAEGNWMAFKPHHAWDSSSPLTNLALFNLGLHSHHHAKAIVHFSELRKNETALKMPYGYSLMLIIALMPFLFVPMMNKRIPVG